VEDLNVKNVLPVHSGKFSLAQHSWDEPLIKITESCKGKNFRICTPMIGEKVNLSDENQKFSEWWKS